LFMGRQVPVWSYFGAFSAAMIGAWGYFARDGLIWSAVLPEGHKYEQLLVICAAVLAIGFASVLLGAKRRVVDPDAESKAESKA
ncbi:MAG: hypothetical protein AAFQ05_04805, partial [Pseudomonadota bacterium]